MVALLEPAAHTGLRLYLNGPRRRLSPPAPPPKCPPGYNLEVGVYPPPVYVAVEKAYGVAPTMKTKERSGGRFHNGKISGNAGSVKAVKAKLPQGTQCGRLKAASQRKSKFKGGEVVSLKAVKANLPQRSHSQTASQCRAKDKAICYSNKIDLPDLPCATLRTLR